MMSISLSLRAAILFAVLAVGEVSAIHQGVSASPKKHRKVKRGHGRCSHHTSSSVPSVSSVLSTSISSSTTIEVSTIWTSSLEPSSFQSLPSSSLSSSTLSSISLSSSTIEAPSTSLPSSTLTSNSIPTSTSEPSTASPSSSSSALQSSSSSWSLPSSTLTTPSSSEVLPSSTIPSTTVPSSTTSQCEPTITTWAPELCWRSIPARCNSMTVTTYAPATVTGHINACNSALRGYDNQFPSEVSGCFENIGQPAFVPTSAWSCISSASIYCSSTTACAPSSTSTSQPIIPPYDNGSFESGSFGSWTLTPPTTPDNLIGSISTDQAHTGSYSLKLQSNNLATEDFIGWSHRVRFEPGSRYEFSFWYYSTSNLSRGTLSIKAEFPGNGIPLVIQMSTQPTAKWLQQKFSITPTTSFGTVSVTYLSQKSTVGSNVVYIDDVTVTKV